MNKRGLIFYLSIYRKILAQDLKSKMSYRADFIISTIGMIFTNVLGFATFWIMFQNFDEINGWNYYEILFLYGFSMIALTPMQCFFDNNWSLRGYVYSGDFVKYCFRPINLFFYYMSEVFDIKGLGQLFMGIGTLVYAWNHIGLGVSALVILKLVLALVTASLFMIAIMNIAAATCFWIVNSGYVMVTVFKFTNYAKYPASIYNNVFKFIFTFIIPVAFVAYYPSLMFLDPEHVPLLTQISPLLGILFFYLSYKIWMKGATSYTGTGS
ncbi:MAG TPA: ABC-2 family transporter protein [Mobilitalea sp.]|nr:ABC-2 family transporter protein [Mobilitalea sp.]